MNIYYIVHAVTLVGYLLLYHFALSSATSSSRLRLLKWEIQAALSLITSLCIKYVRRTTREAFLADVVYYSEGAVVVLTFMLDWRLMAWYLFTLAVLFLTCKQPPPEQSGKVMQLTPLQLENYLADGNQETIRLVELSALWSPRCNQHMQLMTDLSLRYTTSLVQFARIDVGRFPNTSKEYGIDARNLPAYILFEGANEVCRLPQEGHENEKISKEYIIRKFGLDARLIQAMSSRLEMADKYQKVK